MKKKTKKIVGGVGIAAGIAALAAAAAGTYFLYGSKNAAKNRKTVKGWMLKAKGEILSEMENMKDMSEGNYHKAIDTVAKKYKILKHVDKKDLDALVKELKSHWKHIKKDLKSKPTRKSSKR